MSNMLQKLVDSYNLPVGHIDRRKAREKVNKVYISSREVERKWYKRFRKRVPSFKTTRDALLFCNMLCETLGENPLKEVKICPEEVPEGAGACYSNSIICLGYGMMFGTIIHELTHHFGEHSHGNSFCEMEEILFAVAFQMAIGKKLKSDWLPGWEM